jgi:Class II flagellar assembly regulator
MRIATVHGKQPADRSRATKRTAAGGGAFSQCLAEAAAADGASGSASTGVSAMETLFSIQQVDTATDRRSRGQAIRRADILLDQLSDIQADLLAGAVPAGRLQALTKMLRAHRESVDDPRLNDLIDEIELRAEVELAKFDNGG